MLLSHWMPCLQAGSQLNIQYQLTKNKFLLSEISLFNHLFCCWEASNKAIISIALYTALFLLYLFSWSLTFLGQILAHSHCILMAHFLSAKIVLQTQFHSIVLSKYFLQLHHIIYIMYIYIYVIKQYILHKLSPCVLGGWGVEIGLYVYRLCFLLYRSLRCHSDTVMPCLVLFLYFMIDDLESVTIYYTFCVSFNPPTPNGKRPTVCLSVGLRETYHFALFHVTE